VRILRTIVSGDVSGVGSTPSDLWKGKCRQPPTP
jgi:hypothetical protein